MVQLFCKDVKLVIIVSLQQGLYVRVIQFILIIVL